MKANIDLKIRGVKGGNPSWNPNKREVITFIDSSNNYISVDAFENFGNDYMRRKESLIEVNFNGEVWKGTMKELARKLNLFQNPL